MQILKIRLSQEEQDAIYRQLIYQFKDKDELQEIELPTIGNGISLESQLQLYSEYSEPDENNQNHLIYRSVSKFRLTFYHDGEEVHVEDWGIEDRIKKYFER